jgi:trehalose utilization protein
MIDKKNDTPIQITVWGEFRHEKKNPKVASIYPKGMYETIAGFLRADSGLFIRTAVLDEPEHGLGGEPFGLPTPDELIFISCFTGGEVFRSSATWYRGHGRVFYFRPGHETYPSYHQGEVQKIITNAIHWARASVHLPDECLCTKPLEPLPAK